METLRISLRPKWWSTLKMKMSSVHTSKSEDLCPFSGPKSQRTTKSRSKNTRKQNQHLTSISKIYFKNTNRCFSSICWQEMVMSSNSLISHSTKSTSAPKKIKWDTCHMIFISGQQMKTSKEHFSNWFSGSRKMNWQDKSFSVCSVKIRETIKKVQLEQTA